MLSKIGEISGTSAFVMAWFALDAILALFPPLYWVMSGSSPYILGLPLSIFYFAGVGLFISASFVVAYFVDESLHATSA